MGQSLSACSGAHGVDFHGTNGLCRAAAEGRSDELEACLEAVKQQARSQGRKKQRGERRLYKALNRLGPQGLTPLQAASAAGAAGCVTLLLRAHANPMLRDRSDQWTCLHLAARHGHLEAVHALLADRAWFSEAAGWGSSWGDTALDKALYKAFLNGSSRQVLSPLHLAAANGHAATVEALLGYGASPAVRVRCFVDAEQALELQPGASQSDAFPPFSTPLHLAAAQGHTDVVVTLLRAWVRRVEPANMEDLRKNRDLRGQTAMDVARAAGHAHLLHMLDPATPVSEVLSSRRSAVPSLAALAAAALRQQLLGQLRALGGLQEQQAGAAETADEGQASEAAAAAAEEEEEAAPGFDDGCGLGHHHQQQQEQQGDGCPICLEDCRSTAQLVEPAGCSHAVCLPCAVRLCSTGAAAGRRCKPVRCVMCRAIVGGWEAAPCEGAGSSGMPMSPAAGAA